MRPLMIIRKATQSDELPSQEVIKDYVMSFASDAFLFSIFREVRKYQKIIQNYQ